MADRNRFYFMIGIDHLSSSWDPDIPYALHARLYDIKLNKMVYTFCAQLAENKQTNKDLAQTLAEVAKKATGSYCYQYVFFPGRKIKGADIERIIAKKAPSLIGHSYSAGHHHKVVMFDGDKKSKWKIYPDTLYEFNFSKDMVDENAEEFKQFCDWMIQEVGLDNFCKRYTSSQQQIRKKLALDPEENKDSADTNYVPASAFVAEYDFGLNSGGRQMSRYPYQVLPVIGVDINSMYTKEMISNKYSYTKIRKIRFPDEFKTETHWKAVKTALDNKFGVDNYQARIMFSVEKAVLRDPNNPMNIHATRYNKLSSPNKSKEISCMFAEGTFVMFISELIEFLHKYAVKGFKLRLMLHTMCAKFSNKVCDYAYYLWKQAYVKKKEGDNHLSATFKIKKNALPGFFQMNPAKYTNCSDEAGRNMEVFAQVENGKKYGKFPNVLAGSEIVLKSRERHKKLQEFFESRGLEAVYGNNDSLYLLNNDESVRNKVISAVNEWNRINYMELRKDCKHLPSWIDVKPSDAIGGLKIEDTKYIIHAGVNRCFRAGADCMIDDAAISGFNWLDIVGYKKTNIYDLHKGQVFSDVYKKEKSRLVLTDFIF